MIPSYDIGVGSGICMLFCLFRLFIVLLMSIFNVLTRLVCQPKDAKLIFLYKFPWLIKDDRKFIEFIWKKKMNYPLNLDNPKTFNEKLQWMKLYDHNPLYTKMVDKYEAKKYVASIIGEEYIIKTLGVWDKFDEIEFDKLPNQFVLKCTHDSGGLVICKDKSKIDIMAVKNKIEKSLKTDFYLLAREWPYKNVKKQIIAEEYIEDEKTKELRDYKFFCFDGEVKLMFIATDRQNREEPYFDFFDMDFYHIDMRHGHPNAPVIPEKPQHFDLMRDLASKLSNGLKEVRVDFYEANGNVYFGELTFFHHSGLVPFEPSEWDNTIGGWINLA